MRSSRLSAALLLAPALLAAQSTESGRTGLSAESNARLQAMLAVAEDRQLPTESMLNLVAEGRAKGAAEARILSAVAETMTRLELAQSALVRAGREQPSDEEVTRGASIIAHGASATQLEAFVEQAPADRSLVVAFDVLTDLAARGTPVSQALVQVGSRLEARASDVQLRALTGEAAVSAGATAGLGLGLGLGRRP